MLNGSYQGENIIIEKESYSMKLSKLYDQNINVELCECENILKAANNIDQNDDLLVFEIDFKTKDLSSTYIYYEVYDSSLKRLDLNICNDVKINLYPPVIFDESLIYLIEKTSQLGYNIFNESDSFYNDICTKFTTENGTDILLSDRKKDIFTQTLNKSICQIGCEFESYNTKSKKAKCNCEVSKDSISEIISLNIDDLFNKKSIGENFYSTLANSNFRVMKCYYIAFDPSNFPRNYGKTFMTILLISFGITIIIYFIKGIIQIDKLLSTILELIKENNSNDKNEDIDRKDEKNIYKIEGQKDEDKIIQKTIEYAEGNISNPPPPRKIKKINKIKRNKSSVYTSSKMLNTNNDNDNIIQRRNKKRIIKEKVIQKNHIDPEIKIENILYDELGTNNNIYETENNKNQTDKNDIPENTSKMKNLTDPELDDLEYEEAKIYDKRTFFQYYWSNLKQNQLIIFTFLPNSDYNVIYAKIGLFIVSFGLFFSINAFFFSDETMHKIYEDKGIFDFIYQIPQILFSSIISSIIDYILKNLSLSENAILELKSEIFENNLDFTGGQTKANQIQKKLKKKLIIFFGLSSLLMMFFWYFISCFCAVYINTQKILIHDTIFSFILSLIYPFGICLIPGIFRISALRSKNKNKECLYSFSGFVSLI